MEKIKLMMCDDIPELCQFYASHFSQESRINFIGYANTSIECVQMIKLHMPDILLLDIQIEKNDSGINLIPPLMQINPKMKIIMLTIHEDDVYIFKALTLGAVDYIIKTEPIGDIIKKVIGNYEMPGILNYNIAHRLLNECSRIQNVQSEMEDKYKSLLYTFSLISKLSTSEFEILKEIYNGKNYAAIAKERYVEPSTIRAQATSILKKFGYNKMEKLISDLKKTSVIEEFL